MKLSVRIVKVDAVSRMGLAFDPSTPASTLGGVIANALTLCNVPSNRFDSLELFS